jgi:hypothetical protein
MTILGKATVAELKDLVANKDCVIAQLEKAYSAIVSNWASNDIAAQSDWFADWNSFMVRYGSARKTAEAAFTAAHLTTTPNDMIEAQGPWDAILRALKQVDGTVSKGDLQDLDNRLQAAGGNPDYSMCPQPTVNTDVDLNLYKQADTVVKVVTPAVGAAKAAIPWVLIVIGGIVVALVYAVSKVAPVAVPLASGGALRIKEKEDHSDWEKKFLEMRKK